MYGRQLDASEDQSSCSMDRHSVSSGALTHGSRLGRLLKRGNFGNDDEGFCLLLTAIVVAGILAFQFLHHINIDVGVLVWAADQVSRQAVYGRDIWDVSPPLCMLIYMPVVMLWHAVGIDWAVRIWMSVIVAASLVTLWHTADKPLRRMVSVVLAVFILFANPHDFAQREQIALFLCAPYIAGVARGRGWALASGVMAGVGFLIKPHFLIPLALIVAFRRRAGIEERAILAAGVTYGLTLILFFQPYVFEMVPRILAAYWATSFPSNLLNFTLILACLAGLLAYVSHPQPEARPYQLALLGFTAGALLQQKGFVYHFIPAFCFLAIYTVITLRNQRMLAVRVAVVFLGLQVLMHGKLVVEWLDYLAAEGPVIAAMEAEIDNSTSFASLTIEPRAFPKAIRTDSRFVGIALCQIFMPAVIKHLKGIRPGGMETSERLAREQVIRELRNKPELVFVNSRNHNGDYFDILGWYKKDPAFRDLWADYHATRSIGDMVFYRRK